MTVVVITGSTRGIGLGLAEAFLARDCAVVVSGRTQTTVEEACGNLRIKHPNGQVFGCPCDTTDFSQVETLWKATKAHYSEVNIWINNAGVAHPQADFWQQEPELLQQVVNTNILGAMYGTMVAMRGMQEQGFGSIYNLEGLGSDGRILPGMALYGMTKAGLRYLDDALIKEAQKTPVRVGVIRPGMVVTELVTAQFSGRPQDWERFQPILNLIAERVEVVTPWIVQKILTNKKNGAHLSYSNPLKLLGKFLQVPFRKSKGK